MDALSLLKHGKKPGVSGKEKKEMRDKFKEYKQAWRRGETWLTKK
jgi:hypothetical protein